MLNGLLRPTEGVVSHDGQDVAGQRVAALAARVGIVFQNPDRHIFAGKVRDEVAFGPKILGRSSEQVTTSVAAALAAVGLADVADQNPYHLGYSRRKLLALASVLAMDTSVIVLDEPTTGQDARGIQRVQDVVAAVAASGRTVIAISHDMRFVAELFGRVVVNGVLEQRPARRAARRGLRGSCVADARLDLIPGAVHVARRGAAGARLDADRGCAARRDRGARAIGQAVILDLVILALLTMRQARRLGSPVAGPPRPRRARRAGTERPGRTPGRCPSAKAPRACACARVDDAPDHLVDIVGGDRHAVQVGGVDLVAIRRGRRVLRRLVAQRRAAMGRRDVADDQAAGLVGVLRPRAWATIAARIDAGTTTDAGPGCSTPLTTS